MNQKEKGTFWNPTKEQLDFPVIMKDNRCSWCGCSATHSHTVLDKRVILSFEEKK